MSGDLNHSPAEIVQNLLVGEGVGTLPTSGGSWPIYESYERDSPDEVITVYDTSPTTSGRHHVNGETQLHYGVQVRVRSKSKPTGFSKAQDIQNELEEVQRDSITVDSSNYLVQAIHHQGILSIGIESGTTRRRLFTINALVTLRMIN